MEVCRNLHLNPSPSRPESQFGGTSNGGAKTSMAPVSFHTLRQPAPPVTVRLLFSAGGSLALLPVNSFSQPGRKAVPGDLFSEAVFSELGWTSGTQKKKKARAQPPSLGIARIPHSPAALFLLLLRHPHTHKLLLLLTETAVLYNCQCRGGGGTLGPGPRWVLKSGLHSPQLGALREVMSPVASAPPDSPYQCTRITRRVRAC